MDIKILTPNGEIETTKKLLETNILLTLSKIGISENYIGTSYLSKIIYEMIVHDDTSLSFYNTILNQLVSEKNVNKNSISTSLAKVLKKCSDNTIYGKIQFKLKRNSIPNKVRVIVSEVLTSLSNV